MEASAVCNEFLNEKKKIWKKLWFGIKLERSHKLVELRGQ